MACRRTMIPRSSPRAGLFRKPVSGADPVRAGLFPDHPLGHRRAAAVDVDGGAGDVGAGVGGEQARDIGELLGPSHAAERNFLAARTLVVLEIDARLRGTAHVLVGFDQADQQRVDQHVVGRALVGEHLGQRHAGGARHRGGRAARSRRLGPDVEHVDDPPPAAVLHLRPDQPRQPDRGEQFLIEVLPPDLLGDLLERAGARFAGIVHHDVDLAQRRHGFVVGAADIGRDRHVALHRNDAPARRARDARRRLIEGLAPARHDGDVGAFRREPRRHAEADALAAAGDHGGAPGKIDIHGGKTPRMPLDHSADMSRATAPEWPRPDIASRMRCSASTVSREWCTAGPGSHRGGVSDEPGSAAQQFATLRAALRPGNGGWATTSPEWHWCKLPSEQHIGENKHMQLPGNKPRFSPLTMGDLDEQQRPLGEDILKVSRVGLGGPYKLLLRSPVFGRRMFELLRYLRWDTSLPLRLNEFAILIVARHWRSQVEWFAHAPLAEQAGLSPAIIADLKAKRRPADMAADEAAVYDFLTELMTSHEVSDQTFGRARQLGGEQRLVDLTAVAGTYVTVAMLLAMAEEGVPPGNEPPFRPGEP